MQLSKPLFKPTSFWGLLFCLLIKQFAHAQINSDSLISWYPFSGTLHDSGIYQYNITNGSGSFVSNRFGEPNAALQLNGTDDSLVFPFSALSPVMGDFAISLWFKTSSPEVQNLFSIKQAPFDTTNNFEVQLNSHNSYYLENLAQSFYQLFVYWNGSGLVTDAYGTALPGLLTNGEWQHLVLTRSNDSMLVYFNHQLYAASLFNNYGGVMGDTLALVLGSSPYRYNGLIDDLRFYNRTLHQSDVDALWFENNPVSFVTPKPHQAFVQGSTVTFYWEYDALTLSDSILVEYQLNNGNWLPAAHSGLAAENAFVFNLTDAPGTTLQIRISDTQAPMQYFYSALVTISEYDWVEVNDSLPFAPRDGAGLLSFNNELWLMGGWDPPLHPPHYTNNEIWHSSDGINWIYEGTAPWPARHCAAWISDSLSMWVIGGDPQSGCLTDVYRSFDGINWILIEDTIPGYQRRNNVNYARLNQTLFLIGGEVCSIGASSEVWSSSDGMNWNQLPDAPFSGRGMQLNYCVDDANQLWVLSGSNEGTRRSFDDVWKTSDGITWTLVNNNAPWHGRYWHTTAWFDNKMWVMGGVATGLEMNDVWYSSDGITWYELVSTLPNQPLLTRHAQSTTVFDNALWYMCGINTNNAWKIINTSVPVSREENKIGKGFSVIPNPSTNWLTILCDHPQEAQKLNIYNASGQSIHAATLIDAKCTIDISDFENGMYWITLQGYIPQRFIKIE